MTTGRWRFCGAATALVLVLLAGCARPRPYRAADLPADLEASPIQNVQTLDLSRLAAPVESSEQVNAGDVLEMAIAGGLGADAVTRFPIRVGDDGTAQIPEVGPVQLAGLQLAEAEEVIAAACITRGLYLDPTVNVTISRRRQHRVTVVGAVKQPGVYDLSPGSSHLLAALVAAGGLDDNAGTAVEIRQPSAGSSLAGSMGDEKKRQGVQQASAIAAGGESSMRSTRLDLAESVAQGWGGGFLADGSVVMVEKRKPMPIEVIGLVRKPGQYEYPVDQSLTLLSALALAGGMSNQLADEVLVIRNKPHLEQPVVIQVSVSAAKHNAAENLRLQPGDVVSVEQTPATAFMEAVNIIRFGVGTNLPLF